MADARSEFHVWLCSRLKSLNLDEEVLGEYISGILDGDDSTHEEKYEALQETMEGMMESPDANVTLSIFEKWKEFEDQKEKLKQEKNQKEDILAAVVEKHTKATNVNKKPSHQLDEDVKKSLIAQYGQESDEDYYSSSGEETQTNKTQQLEKALGLFENTNAKSVLDKEKEKRDKQRQENEDKKVKNKEDREKQKAKVEQRKDKEKKRTQKGERRR
ncbi:coiled-coil domain-containing protein 43-like isoform X2 [Dendronephthya gigantea]|uniref:coiled-coil domain-containing protein 43-like isoform X2 n=1 Tax=Dendronephthya gigantea TaxID=151771 RepID=UPI00106937F4|nr:coiled-coil domain-containing protein 43-like isoform X2 [Dendronephthya gigantea]